MSTEKIKCILPVENQICMFNVQCSIPFNVPFRRSGINANGTTKIINNLKRVYISLVVVVYVDAFLKIIIIRKNQRIYRNLTFSSRSIGKATTFQRVFIPPAQLKSIIFILGHVKQKKNKQQ